jgi:Tfp pilus assembly protein PilX
MKKNKITWAADQRGMVMLIVLMMMAAVSVLGMAALTVVVGDIRVAGNYRDSAAAFWAAEAGLQQGLQTLRQNSAFTGTVTPPTLTNNTTNVTTVTVLSGSLVRVVATGRKGQAEKVVEAVVSTDSAYTAALNGGGNITMSGKPRISSQGVRVNGSGNLDLDPGTPTINMYMPPSSTLTVTGNNAVNRVNSAPMDLGAIAMTQAQWLGLAQQAAPSAYYDTDGIFGSLDTNVTFNNLDFSTIPVGPSGQRTIFVDGNVTLNGSLSGIGTIIATGSIIGEGGFVSSGATVSMVSQSDVLLNFDTNAQSSLNGLVYAQGNYELHGKIMFTGVVTCFGSIDVQNPSQFTNNSDPNFWYTYSSAYSVLSEPAHVLSWAQDQ